MVKIIKILRVEDTRNWEEIEDDKWIPIPGTGIENNCGRCGRSHEVHATVEVEENGVLGQIIVGTGCMHADEAEVAGKIRSILNAQQTLEKNRRLLAKKEALYTEWVRIHNEALALTPPKHEVEVVENPVVVGNERKKYPTSERVRVGDVYAWMSSNHPSDWSYMLERIECAEQIWRNKREDESGMTMGMRHAHHWLKDLKKRSEKKIAGFGLQEAGK